MARTLPQHKALYDQFLDPRYPHPGMDGQTVEAFERFHQERLAEIPNEGAPAEGYFYNTHMGAYVRSLDEAKYHLIQAKLAFFHKRTLVENPQGVVETSEKK